jgi:capsule polysaccharide export protein KpsE/RkpR
LGERYGKPRAGDTRKALEQRTEIAATSKDGLIRLTIEDTDAAMSATLANGYVEEYRKFSANLAVTEAAQRRLFLEQQVAQTRERLAKAEEALKQRQQSSGVIQLDGQTRALIESAATLRAQVAAKQVQLQSLASYETAENPEVQVARQQLSALEGQLRMLTGGGADGGEVLVPKGKLPEAGLDYLRNLREVKFEETVFELLAKQYESARLDEARQGAVLQVVDAAVVPDRRSGVPRSVMVLGGMLLGLLAGVGLVLWRARTLWLGEDGRAVAEAWGIGHHT